MDPRTLDTLKRVLPAPHSQAVAYTVAHAPTVSLKTAWYFSTTSSRTDACLTAHLDTVWDGQRSQKHPCRLYHDPTARVLWSPDGLGADDRAGLVASFLIRQRTGCALLVCDGEERGGIGSQDACLSSALQPMLAYHRFFIGMDRKGTKEFVCYAGEPRRFKRWVRRVTGYTETLGTFSDTAILARELDRPACNLATGYTGEHTKSEMLQLDHLDECIRAATALVCARPPQEFGPWTHRDRRPYWYGETYDHFQPSPTARTRRRDSRPARRRPTAHRQPAFYVDAESRADAPYFECGRCGEYVPASAWCEACERCAECCLRCLDCNGPHVPR